VMRRGSPICQDGCELSLSKTGSSDIRRLPFLVAQRLPLREPLLVSQLMDAPPPSMRCGGRRDGRQLSGRRASPRSSTVVPSIRRHACDRDGGSSAAIAGTAMSGATQLHPQTRKSPARFPARAQFRSFNFPNKLICTMQSIFGKWSVLKKQNRPTAHPPRICGYTGNRAHRFKETCGLAFARTIALDPHCCD
jgi:hypothetical protein